MPNTDIKIIANDDGTTGYIQSANKYFTSQDYNRKFQLLKQLSDKKVVTQKTIKAGGTQKKLDTTETGDTTGLNIMNFITKLQKFQFAPPSDNLWVVKFSTYSKDGENSNVSLETLYDSIIQANKTWTKITSPKWKVALNDKNIDVKSYIKDFHTKSGVFLAQNVNFTPQSVKVVADPFSQGQQHNSFFNFGFIAQGRQINRSLKISFLVSNWDICDILFEPWIAAVAQRGLLQDGISSSIKARIILEEYSKGIPKSFNDKESIHQMECRKQYIFDNCVPINRGSVERDYDFNNAGTFKSSIIEFNFQDYQIKYLI